MSLESAKPDAALIADPSQTLPALTENPQAAYLEQRRAVPANTDVHFGPARSGEALGGAFIGGGLVGLGSQYYGPAMLRGAAEMDEKMTVPFKAVRTRQWLRSALGVEGRLGEHPFLSRDTIANAATKTVFGTADFVSDGLSATSYSKWEPGSWDKSLFNGAAVGVADYVLDSALASTTGMSVFKPNVIDTSLVTAATISPIPGNYKLAAIRSRMVHRPIVEYDRTDVNRKLKLWSSSLFEAPHMVSK